VKSSLPELVGKLGPALLGLAGTLLVALLGFYQWRRQQERSRREEYTASKRKAYEGLWNMLEEVNLQLRENKGNNPALHAQLKSANTFFLQHSLYLDESEQDLINKYIAALHRLRTAIYTSGDEDVTDVWRVTGSGIPTDLDRELGDAAKEVSLLREKIKSRVREVVSS